MKKCEPLLVFINPRSGGNDGAMLLKWFYMHFNPIQVTDLSMESPAPLLTAFKGMFSKKYFRSQIFLKPEYFKSQRKFFFFFQNSLIFLDFEF